MMRIEQPELLNSLEVIQVREWMERRYSPEHHYTVRPGNSCVWVHWGSTVPINLYFIFRNSQIADIQVD